VFGLASYVHKDELLKVPLLKKTVNWFFSLFVLFCNKDTHKYKH
jgi:hypothetical protein